MMTGWELRVNDQEVIIIQKEEYEIKFDIRISTTEGCVWAGYLRRTKAKESEVVVASVATKVSIQKARDLLGHSNEEARRATAKYLK